MKIRQTRYSMIITKKLMRWWIFAIICRLIASATHAHWFHPDEWCQTIEPANILAHGFGFHSQEIGLHLRNLSWPVLIAGVLKFTHWISPSSIDLRIFGVSFFCGLLDLIILWGWLQLLKTSPWITSLSERAQNWSLALLLLPWFTVYQSVSPRGEHLSEIALWAALGCAANAWWIWTGISCVAIFSFRYPSGLLSIGIVLAIAFSFTKKKNIRVLRNLGCGLILGTVLFGIPDWMIYGRPWESLWMYLQYNIFTGSSAQVFGKQGISAYAELFQWNWATYPALIPLGILLVLSGIYGMGCGIGQPWMVALTLYIAGHILVPHKEGRFLFPVETLMRWSAFYGAVLFIQSSLFTRLKLLQKSTWNRSLRIATVSLLTLTLISNGVIFLHALKADQWKFLGTYREIGRHLEENPGTCVILTGREVTSLTIPFQEAEHFPSPSIGYYQAQSLANKRHLKSYTLTEGAHIEWIEHPPSCQSDTQTQNTLLHTYKADPEWIQHGCTLLPSGILRVLPRRAWPWALDRNLLSGAWYRCPLTITHHFGKQKVSQLFSRTFGKIPSLPKLGISPTELEMLGHEASPPPRDAFLPSIGTPQSR